MYGSPRSQPQACLFLFPLGEKGLETCRRKGSTAWDFLAELFPARQASEGCATGGIQDLRKLIVLWFGFGMCGSIFFFFFKSERMSNLQVKASSHTGKTSGKILVSHLSLVSQGSSFRNGSSVSAGLQPKFVKLIFFGHLNWIIRVVFSLLSGKW